MDDRRKTLAAITIIIGFFVLILIAVGLWITGRSVISPVPEDKAIRIIFITPTPQTDIGGDQILPPADVTPSRIP